MRQCDQDPMMTGKGLATTGLVLGIIGAVLLVILLIVGIAFMDFFLRLAEDMDQQNMIDALAMFRR